MEKPHAIKKQNINGYHYDPIDGFYLRKDEDAPSDLESIHK